jgi:hypothetical protein
MHSLMHVLHSSKEAPAGGEQGQRGRNCLIHAVRTLRSHSSCPASVMLPTCCPCNAIAAQQPKLQHFITCRPDTQPGSPAQ